MKYSINMGIWSSIFSIPTDIVDNHIKKASGYQLKILLWILRNNGCTFTENDIATALAISVEDVKDNIQYWIENDILTENKCTEKINESCSDNAQNITEKNVQSDEIKENTPPLSPASVPLQKMPLPKIFSGREIAIKISQSSELAALIKMCEPLCDITANDYSKAGRLITLHEYYGLPCDVIVMIVQYAYHNNKNNLAYIEKIALDWAENGINTHEKAEERILSMDNDSKTIATVYSAFGMKNQGRPSKQQFTYANEWVNNWKFSKEMLSIAYEICLDNTSKCEFSYINKILSRWYSQGIITPEQAYADKEKFKAQYQKNSTSYTNTNKSIQSGDKYASYDIELYEKLVAEGKI